MSAYNIMYFDDANKIIKSETVFMNGLRGAKISSSSFAPFFTVKIELRDIVGKLLATKENNSWINNAAIAL
ncbi:hypothetical protein C0Z01_09900 [Photobacterium kishitanii]|uniref:Uncharacterized protein n=1 Tax=Photobacterium kishitanii TaxID=318456 RepID=A0A2T3KJ62_9GAMM|nr:hypothetical protein [Photobacterium kishitanii]OBU29284.1 hypothetical protein AYY22_01850 [Photobacterium kishitanii]OBU32059.1 hypothetical protein AYY23_02765 [Photobacterium kishitanii]PSU88249.1 hypothetical protein C0W42_13180 [Photobacterium kishitanii]PSU93229.1 hypothetical protein C0W35_12620 [Photobacterium kishitanii]PSU99556.1 hypothetical protein C9J27_07905 [Photobacterium kishitanii]